MPDKWGVLKNLSTGESLAIEFGYIREFSSRSMGDATSEFLGIDSVPVRPGSMAEKFLIGPEFWGSFTAKEKTWMGCIQVHAYNRESSNVYISIGRMSPLEMCERLHEE